MNTPAGSEGTVYRKAAECAARSVGEETVLVPIRRNVAELESVFVTNEVGKAIWEVLDSPQTLDEVVKGIAERFIVPEAEARKDAAEFLGALLEARLIETVGGAK
jgi:hypothetical protein